MKKIYLLEWEFVKVISYDAFFIEHLNRLDDYYDTVYNISNTPLFACPYCNSKDVIKKGIYKTSIVESQKYLCKECGEKYKIPLTFFT